MGEDAMKPGFPPKRILKVEDVENETLRTWLDQLGRRNGHKRLLITKEEGKDGETNYRTEIFTEKHKYSIVAHGERYLGCVMSNRAPYPGENHIRGNDFPDGSFSHETWVNILVAIVAYESLEIKIY